MRDHDVDTPLATHLAELTRKGRCHNFHAVPWPGVLDTVSPEVARRYRTLLGTDLPLIDGSWSGGSVDSFFCPQGPLAAAQRRAAKAFGADATFFGTNGTTASNHIALESIRHSGTRVLLDCTAHQSLLFATETMDVTLAPCSESGDSTYLDPVATARLMAGQASQNRPFDAVILSATGYDGRRMRLDRVLPMLVAASPTTALVIDEAWSALHAFAPEMVDSTALAVASRLAARGPVLVTQSAHKTMAALRQGSYLHVLGTPQDIERVRKATYRLHTTSPSWPILASLDLARAHAQEYGAAAFVRARRLRDTFETTLRHDPRTAPLLGPPIEDPYHDTDPLVVRLAVGSQSRALRDWLFAEHHVLVAIAGDQLVARMHLGITESDLDALATGIRELASGSRPAVFESARLHTTEPEPAIGSRSLEYIIPYPPGVPLARPGEVWTTRHATAWGTEIHHLPPSHGMRPVAAPDETP